jgi:DNA-binding transcriptional LysR family regulator
MELRQLRHFVKVAERRNFSDASVRAHISQPALSRSIQQLEHDVGATLLRRSPSGVALTPAGERFLQFARMIVAEADRAAAAVAAVHAGTIGEVTVGLDALYPERLVASAALRCRTELPGVVLRTVAAPTEELPVLLRRGVVDLALAGTLPEDQPPGNALEPLAASDAVVIAAASHPLAQVAAPAATELATARWILIQHAALQDMHARLFLSHSLPVPRAVRSNSVALIRGLVIRRGFLTILPRDLASQDLKSGVLRVIRTGSTAETHTAGMMHLAASPPRDAAARVADILRETCLEPHRRRLK